MAEQTTAQQHEAHPLYQLLIHSFPIPHVACHSTPLLTSVVSVSVSVLFF